MPGATGLYTAKHHKVKRLPCQYTRREQEKLLLNSLKETPGDLATTKLLGRWNLDVEIHFKDSKELQQFIIGLRNKFEIIEDYEIAQIIEDYGIDFFPEKVALV